MSEVIATFLGLLGVFAWPLLLLFGHWVWTVAQKRYLEKRARPWPHNRYLYDGKVQETWVAMDEKRVDKRLWELLHQDDPAWLLAMGIEKPEALGRRRESSRLNKTDSDRRRQQKEASQQIEPLRPANAEVAGAKTVVCHW